MDDSSKTDRFSVETSNSKLQIATRIPELDGVRGIAISRVAVYHAFLFSINRPTGWVPTLVPYGFAGVDLFFVLSGFLITTILLNAKGRPGYFRNFYARRALRIWPLYYLLLLVAFGLVPLLIRHSHVFMDEFDLLKSRNKFVYILLLQNLWYPGAQPTTLAMTWSLAIEEQFYVVWPWLVLWWSRKKLACILAIILVLSPFLRLWAKLHGVSENAIDDMTCFRLDGLSLGALLALYCKCAYFSLRFSLRASLTALAIAVPASLWLLSGHSRALSPFLYSMLALSSAGIAAFAIWCCQTNSIWGRPFRTAWLCYLGQVSYCFYLVHQPVYYALRGKLAQTQIGAGPRATILVMVVGFAVSLIIASLSWYLFESQILKLKGKLSLKNPTHWMAVPHRP